MSDPSDIGAILLAVGELKGKVGEIAHGQNDMRQKVDGIAARVLTAPTREDYNKLGERVDALEKARDRDDGAKGIISRIVESRAFGVVITALLSAFAALAAIKGGLTR